MFTRIHQEHVKCVISITFLLGGITSGASCGARGERSRIQTQAWGGPSSASACPVGRRRLLGLVPVCGYATLAPSQRGKSGVLAHGNEAAAKKGSRLSGSEAAASKGPRPSRICPQVKKASPPARGRWERRCAGGDAGSGCTVRATASERGRGLRAYTSYWGRSCSAMTSMPSPVVSAVCTASIAATKALAPESAVTQVTPRRMASVRTL